MEVSPFEMFIQCLIKGLSTITYVMGVVEFRFGEASFSILDMSVYSMIIGSTLAWIHSHYSAAGTGRNRTVFKKNAERS